MWTAEQLAGCIVDKGRDYLEVASGYHPGKCPHIMVCPAPSSICTPSLTQHGYFIHFLFEQFLLTHLVLESGTDGDTASIG